jgi:hypothetical protein
VNAPSACRARGYRQVNRFAWLALAVGLQPRRSEENIMHNNTQSNGTYGMQDIAADELTDIDGGGFWAAVGCGILGGIAEGLTNNPAVGVGVFVDCYF